MQNLIKGNSGTILLVGASNSGKSQTLIGKGNKGILYKTVNRILQTVTPFIGQMDPKTFDGRLASAIMANEVDYFKDNVADRSFLRVSIYLVHKESILDLLMVCSSKSAKSAKIETYID